MSNDEIVRIIMEQHEIRAARFQAGPHSDTAMGHQVRDMLHLNDYLTDQGL